MATVIKLKQFQAELDIPVDREEITIFDMSDVTNPTSVFFSAVLKHCNRIILCNISDKVDQIISILGIYSVIFTAEDVPTAKKLAARLEQALKPTLNQTRAELNRALLDIPNDVVRNDKDK